MQDLVGRAGKDVLHSIPARKLLKDFVSLECVSM